MDVALFSSKSYTREFFETANDSFNHKLQFFEARLAPETVELAKGFGAVCPFVNDNLNADVIRALAENGTRLIALRSAGFNHVDLKAAQDFNLTVCRVPAYSPYSVAEHAVGLILSLNRKTHRAYYRVREGNMSLEGLIGFDLRNKTVGIIGTGAIGTAFARIMHGFGCRLLAYDPRPNDECREYQVEYTDLNRIFGQSDIISLHCPLNPHTDHLIDGAAIEKMKPGVMIINTGRGALIDTRAVIDHLKSGRVGYLGLDVYEEEEDLFFEDLSNRVIQDDTFARLLTFPNVLITGHQGFFTREALRSIARTTLDNIHAFEDGAIPEENLVHYEKHHRD